MSDKSGSMTQKNFKGLLKTVTCHFFYVQSWMAKSPEIGMFPTGYIIWRVCLLLERIRDWHRKYTDAEGQTEERGPEMQRVKDQAVF